MYVTSLVHVKLPIKTICFAWLILCSIFSCRHASLFQVSSFSQAFLLHCFRWENWGDTFKNILGVHPAAWRCYETPVSCCAALPFPNYALWLFLFCTTLEWLWWIKFPLENFCTLAPYELVLGIFCSVCCLTRMACTSTSNQFCGQFNSH